jgi:glycosidase
MAKYDVLSLAASAVLALGPIACGVDTSPAEYNPPSLGNGNGGDGGSSGSGTGSSGGGNPPPGTDGGLPASEGGGVGPGDGASDDASFVPPATCPETFSLPDNGYTTVVLNTDYDNWSGAIPLTKSGTTWQVTTPVPYGKDVEFKFVADGNWLVSSSSPTITLPSTAGTNTNNVLEAVTCGIPTAGSLKLVGSVAATATSYSFQVRYVPGSADIDPSKTVITLNGAGVAAGAVPYDSGSHTFTVSVSSGVSAPNKYGYLFEVQDTNGFPARLFVPFWVEATSFSWSDSFMYEVMVDRFLPGGTSKLGPNGPPTEAMGDWKGGDFGGVTQKISDGYFDAMGVNTLWLSSPVLGTKLCEMGTGANTGHCLSGYHSYFPIASGWTYGSESDPLFASAGITGPIDPHFGTAADLVTLVNTAHQHGIRVLTDLVVNHVFADPSPPSGQAPQIGPLWTAHQTDLAWFNVPYGSGYNDCGDQNLWDTPTTQTWNRADCWFDPYLPDFNSTNPTLDDALADHAVWLMEQFNLDGFRVDAVKQVTNDICVHMRSKIDAAISTGLPFYMVGEALGSVTANVMDCVGPDKLNGSVDDPIHNTIVGTILQSDSNAATDLDNGVKSDESTWTGAVPSALMGHFFGSHDTPRAISLANGDNVGAPWTNPPPAQETNAAAFSRLQLAQAFLLTYDSIPILWMGDEFGMPGAIDPDCRRMMRFGSALSAQEQATLTTLQKLGKARAAHVALREGTRTTLLASGTFYAYGRLDVPSGDIVVVALNMGASSVTQAVNVAPVGLTGTATDVLSGGTASVAGGSMTITVPALTAAVYTR